MVCQSDFLSRGCCLSDVSAVQIRDPCRRAGGRAGRADQRHPAQGHQPLPGRRGQRCPLSRVSTGALPRHGALPTLGTGRRGHHSGEEKMLGFVKMVLAVEIGRGSRFSWLYTL